jgi:hypothetical protein
MLRTLVGDVQASALDHVEYNLINSYEIINDYTKRSFSIAEDIFPAIAGLTEEIQK